MSEQPGSGEGGSGSDPDQGYGPQPPAYPGQSSTPGPPAYPGQQYPPPSQPQGYPSEPQGYPPPPPYGSPQPAYPGQPQGYPPPPPPYGGPQPAYPGQPPGYPGYPGQQPVKRGYTGWAIAAFVTGLIIPFLGILVAIPLGIVALVKISRHGFKGRWMAITGMVLSVLWVAGAVAIGIWFASTSAARNDQGDITSSGRLDFGDIRTGDCVKISGLDSGSEIGLFDITGVPCVDSHNAQAVFVVTFGDTSNYPGAASIGRQASSACAPHYSQFRGQGLTSYTLYPTSARWDQSNGHRAICFVTKGADETMTGSVLK